MHTPSDFRRGLRIIVDDQPYYVVEYQHFKMGRGKANIRTKLKHIKTGAVVEKVFSSNDSFKEPDMEFRKMQYLYENTGQFAFMDSETYEQIEIPVDNLGDAKWYLLENEEYKVAFLDNEAISLDLPAAVILEVVETRTVRARRHGLEYHQAGQAPDRSDRQGAAVRKRGNARQGRHPHRRISRARQLAYAVRPSCGSA